jgi:magnesium-transporting ATPase (P-type)
MVRSMSAVDRVASADDTTLVHWHALATEEVEERLGASRSGLTSAEAEERLARHGPNTIEEDKPPSDLAILLHQFTSPLIYILLAAGVVTIIIGEYIDAGVIAVVLALNAIIGFVQERQAERSVRALRSLVAPKATVLRDGGERELDSADLVPGDLVLLESGRRVPADLRLFAPVALAVDESLLTGESVPVGKQEHPVDEEAGLGDRLNMTYTGAVVTSGRSRGYVVATGAGTELGRIATSVREEKEAQTPLQQRMNRFARVIGLAVAVSAGAAIILGLALGESLEDMILVAVALAVAAVPEGLPVVFTITLALGVRRMARRKAIVRRLPAVETLGSTTVIGSDKTGTLTENRMTVQEVRGASQAWQVPPGTGAGPAADGVGSGEGAGPAADGPGSAAVGAGSAGGAGDGTLPEPLRQILLAGTLANEASISVTQEGIERRGDPTESAILVAAHRFGMEPWTLRDEHATLLEVPFEPEHQFSGSLRSLDSRSTYYVKGAPERVLAMCDRAMTDEGAEGDLDLEAVRVSADELAGHGLRVLAMAQGAAPANGDLERWAREPEGLVFLGLVGMMDPPRQGVPDAIRGCQEAGIRVVMITGDHAATARAIGESLGIAREGSAVLTGAELARLDDAGLRERVGDVSIYARVAPDQKLRIVRALQAEGEVVAVTGDGVNDAPALKAAEIGVAMGKAGTDIAREASDIVLTNDDFVSIYAAVEEGRVTFDNLRKVTFFLISTGAASIIMILTALLLGWPLPMLPAQLLWLNLVTNGLQDVALAFEPGEPEAVRRPPRPRREGVISALLWERTAISGLVMAAGTLLIFQWELGESDSLASARTAALTTMVLFQMFQAWNARSEHRSIFRMNPFSNPFLFLAIAGALAIHVAALYLAPTQLILRVVPVDLDTWLAMLLTASTLIAVVEAHKAVRRRWPLRGRGEMQAAAARP